MYIEEPHIHESQGPPPHTHTQAVQRQRDKIRYIWNHESRNKGKIPGVSEGRRVIYSSIRRTNVQ